MVMRHIIVALIVSYAASLAFWAAFGVFAAGPFVVVSTACAFAGAAAGLLAGRRLWATVAATLIIRVAAYLAATGQIGF